MNASYAQYYPFNYLTELASFIYKYHTDTPGKQLAIDALYLIHTSEKVLNHTNNVTQFHQLSSVSPLLI